jgi:hypothetical protein
VVDSFVDGFRVLGYANIGSRVPGSPFRVDVNLPTSELLNL